MSSQPSAVIELRQNHHIQDPGAASKALLGACILGALDHLGVQDLDRLDRLNREDVRLSELARVFRRGDTGLHGCGFEYAVHHALRTDSALPRPVVDVVRTALSSEVGAVLSSLGIDWSGWPTGLRSVMYGVEKTVGWDKRARLRRESRGQAAAEELGQRALLWPSAGADPVLLSEVLPGLRWPGPRSAAPETEWADLWRADLFLGGASVSPPAGVSDVSGEGWTAWIAATLKYRAGRVQPGNGIHLGIETSYGTVAGRFATEVSVTGRGGLRVVTLPLDGEFLTAYNVAFQALRLWAQSPRPYSHPTDAPHSDSARIQHWLHQRRSGPAFGLAEGLLHRDEPAMDAASRLLATEPHLIERVPGVPATERLSGLVAPVPMRTAA